MKNWYMVGAVLHFLMAALLLIGSLGTLFTEEGGFLPFVFMLVVSFFFGSSGYIFFKLHEADFKIPQYTKVVKQSVFSEKNSDDNEELEYEDDVDDICFVDNSPIYQFEYMDSKGDISKRRIKVNSIERKNGRLYVNATDLDKHANRTFRVDRMENPFIEETGEYINETELEDHFSGVFN